MATPPPRRQPHQDTPTVAWRPVSPRHVQTLPRSSCPKGGCAVAPDEDHAPAQAGRRAPHPPGALTRPHAASTQATASLHPCTGTPRRICDVSISCCGGSPGERCWWGCVRSGLCRARRRHGVGRQGCGRQWWPAECSPLREGVGEGRLGCVAGVVTAVSLRWPGGGYRRPPGPIPGGRRLPAGSQAREQVLPLRVKAEGAAVLPVWVAWKPMSTEPPAGIEPL